MTVKQRGRGWTIPPILAVMLFFPPATLRGENRRLTVTGHSHIEVKPDTFEITIPISGSGTLASQALQNFRDVKKRAVDAIHALKIEGLSVTFSGTQISGNMNLTNSSETTIINGRVAAINRNVASGVGPARGGDVFRDNLVMRVANIDRLTEDQIQDLYAKFSEDLRKSKDLPPTNFSVVFRLDNSGAAKEQALDQAIADARARAKQLARLLGVKIGKVIHAQEHETDNNLFTPNRPVRMNVNVRGRQAVLSAIDPKLTVTASVLVEFEILD